MSVRSRSGGDDVFISYAHVDNKESGGVCWVTRLHDELKVKLDQLAGKDVVVWRDLALDGNSVFSAELSARLGEVTALIAVCTPTYLSSDWCDRELKLFMDATRHGGGLQVGTRSRLFKVLKTPVPLAAQPAALRDLLGYTFYGQSSFDHQIREFLDDPDESAAKLFFTRMNDLAADIVFLLDLMNRNGESSGSTIYLADCTSDELSDRDDVSRELQRHSHDVLPRRVPGLAVTDLTAAIEEDLSQSQFSIHLMGTRYGARPEGDDRSIPHLELMRAADMAEVGRLTQLVWVPESLEPTDALQRSLVDGLLAGDVAGGEVVRAPLEEFKAYMFEKLRPPAAPSDVIVPESGKSRVYVVHDLNDCDAALPLVDELAQRGHLVTLPLRDGTEAETREVHENEMAFCDAVIIYYGTAREHWVRMKQFDLRKASGWGRTEPFRAAAVWIDEPVTASKRAYTSADAMVIDATTRSLAEALAPFLHLLASSAAGR